MVRFQGSASTDIQAKEHTSLEFSAGYLQAARDSWREEVLTLQMLLRRHLLGGLRAGSRWLAAAATDAARPHGVVRFVGEPTDSSTQCEAPRSREVTAEAARSWRPASSKWHGSRQKTAHSPTSGVISRN